MKRRGGGSILNVSSRAGIGFAPHRSPEYAASKAALCRFTATLAPLAEEAGIRVNCICPDWVETERIREERLEMGEEEWSKHGPAELVSVEDIADGRSTSFATSALPDARCSARTTAPGDSSPWTTSRASSRSTGPCANRLAFATITFARQP
jgi:NAD(P)-dependent dehydrogenase (short-subunit alcohol dehydrogenase family)